MLQGVSALVAPATLLTGIAFYFGWQRVKAFDGYFGLEPSAVGYSTRDYVLNSLDALFLPVIVVLLALMALAFVHAYLGNVHRAGERPQALRRLAQLGLTGGVLLLLVGGIGAFGAFPFHTPYLVATLFPAGGVLLIAHAVDLRSRLRGAPPLSLGGRVLVGLFVAVCLFWAAGLYAETVGRDQAARLARHLDELPGVTISSTADLGLPTGSARAATSSGTSTSSAQEAAGGTTVHVYGGLRLLAQAGGTLFLLPGSWTAKRGTLFAVSQSDGMRIALTPAIVRHSGSLVSAGPNNESVVEATGPAPGYLRPVSRKAGPLVVRVVGRVTGSKVKSPQPDEPRGRRRLGRGDGWRTGHARS